MILRIIRWIFGYMIFKTDSKNSQIFFNLVSKSKTSIWDVKQINKIIYAKVNLEEYFRLSKILIRNNVKLHPIKEVGAPIIYKMHKNRKGIILGLFIFLVNINFLSLFIWKINIIGPNNLKNDRIIEYCKDNNIFIGALKKNIDAQASAQDIMNKIPEISWISINLDGCVANVQVNEQIEKLTQEDEKVSNIVSSCDAQIERMETFSGTPLVKPGDVVFENQLLVGAYYKDSDGSLKDICAKANIFAKVHEKISECEKFEQNRDIETGKEKKIFKLRIFGNDIKINFWEIPENDFIKEEFETKLNIFGMDIPVSFITHRFHKTKKIKIFLTRDEALENAKKRAYEKLNSMNIEYLGYEESHQEIPDGIVFEINFDYLKNIARHPN